MHAIMYVIIIGLDCGGVISNVPNLFMLHIIANLSLPVRDRRICIKIFIPNTSGFTVMCL